MRLVRVHGRVQGVGFREACVAQARALGISGWVRNRVDGSVEVLMRGRPDALAQLEAWLRHGPPLAQVRAVEPGQVPADGPTVTGRFERRPTA